MQRRIIGSYQESHEAVREIERLMNEGYVGEDILVITDNKTSHQKDLENLSLVEVDAIDPNEEKSFWEKAKEALSFKNYDSDASHSPLTEYGVDENEAKSYEKALQDGNILLLVNRDASPHLKNPVNQSQDSTQSHNDIEYSKEVMKEDYEPTPGDDEMFDPSKAQSSREDKLTEEEKTDVNQNSVNDKTRVTPTEGNGDIPSNSAEAQRKENAESETGDGKNESRLEDQEAPQVTGDETSVDHSEGTHRYPDKVNDGPVNSPTDPLVNKHVEKKGS